jgi:glycosyltransferase involved in cell wall biosynthesis
VREHDAAMEFPLSVLEAMASDLPVVAYPYGGLPLALAERHGLVFAKTDDEMLAAVRQAKDVHAYTRWQAKSFGWATVVTPILNEAEVRNAADLATAV